MAEVITNSRGEKVEVPTMADRFEAAALMRSLKAATGREIGAAVKQGRYRLVDCTDRMNGTSNDVEELRGFLPWSVHIADVAARVEEAGR